MLAAYIVLRPDTQYYIIKNSIGIGPHGICIDLAHFYIGEISCTWGIANPEYQIPICNF